MNETSDSRDCRGWQWLLRGPVDQLVVVCDCRIATHAARCTPDHARRLSGRGWAVPVGVSALWAVPPLSRVRRVLEGATGLILIGLGGRLQKFVTSSLVKLARPSVS